MRQSNGAQLFPAHDSRATAIGLIEADADDSRQNILAAILTQEKLGRKQTVVALEEQPDTFRRASDFSALEQMLPGLHTQLVFIAPQDSSIGKFARRHHLLLFASLDLYAQYARTFISQKEQSDDVAKENEETQPQPENAGASPVPETQDVVENEPPPRTTPLPLVNVEDEPTRPVVLAPVTEDIPPANPPATAPATEEEAGPTPIILTVPSQKTIAPEPPDSTPPASPVPTPQPDPTPASASTIPHTHHPFSNTGLIPATRLLPGQSVPRRRRRIGKQLITGILCVLVILLIAGTIFGGIEGIGPLARLFSTNIATITVVPDSTTITHTYEFSATTQTIATPDFTHQQVLARFISSTTAPKKQTVPASGQGSVQATQAQGMLTFYNPSQQQQTIAANTVITDSHGVKVVNDQQVIIGAAQAPAEATATVSAHALTAGAQGNIAANDINTSLCCPVGVIVRNLTAFTDGQNAYTFTYVEQSDINVVAQEQEKSLATQGQQQLQGQIQPNEQSVGPPQCSPLVTADHSAGEMATNVTVTVVETCVEEVYDQRGALQMAELRLHTDAQQQQGNIYALTGHIVTTITSASVEDQNGMITLQVQARGIWVYQFPVNWKAQIAHLTAGKSITQAQSLLHKQPGVSKAQIIMARGAGNILSTDLQKIHVVVQHISGF